MRSLAIQSQPEDSDTTHRQRREAKRGQEGAGVVDRVQEQVVRDAQRAMSHDACPIQREFEPC